MQGATDRVLVTGAGGFIGSHLVDHLVAQGYQVNALVQYRSNNSWGWLEHSPFRDRCTVVSGNILDYRTVQRAAQDCRVIFHLAALVSIPYSYHTPTEFVKTNVEGTDNVLQAAQERAVEQVIVASTSEVYGTAKYVPIDEKHPIGAQSPYAASKIGAEQLALSYFRSFGLPVKVIRPFNAFGPRQSARAIIPTIILQILDGARQIQLGNLYPTRDFSYVLDTVSGMLAVAAAESLTGQVVNIGSAREKSIQDLAGVIARLMGQDIIIQSDHRRTRPVRGEVDRLLCDCQRVQKATSWQPQYTLEAGLVETISWFKKHHHLYKSNLVNI